MPPRRKSVRPLRRDRPGKTVPPSLLAAALRAQSEGVFIAACSGGPRGLKILFVNDSFCAMTGRPAVELIGRSHGLLHVDPADVTRLRRWLRQARPGHPLTGDGLLVRGDGKTISTAWSFDPLFNARGRVTHVVATYRDQTEKRRLQEALVHAQRLDAVGRLAGGVAHDFNNLLSVINGYCEILAAHVSANPQAMREVAEIHHAGRKAAALTQQLLAFSRRRPLDARVINLNTLIHENAEILQRLLGDAGKLQLELTAGLPNVRTDPAQFQQVILNLILNARDALRDDGHIRVSTAVRDIGPGETRRPADIPPGRYVTLTIADNGTGMDAETQKHLFEPFFTTKPEGKGTGLGLALVYGVVQQSGGYISVRSEVLVGSTFEVLLPPANEPVVETPPIMTPLQSMRGSENVLLVEEDDVVRKMVAGILTSDGYRVTARKSFTDAAREPMPSRPFHLFIGSLAGEGEKFARRLVDACPGLRVLCTSQNDFKMPVGWIPPGRQAVINKPYALSELMRAARKLLDT
ncbi:ATP-binding protein [Horticoccus sp. 23ND18S-11]|uniref:ATP-binding protein n=1 Tax=Horticoccus sp. 23ND18S-11 TaxID=3391832 RepID=UPI0039C9D1EE